MTDESTRWEGEVRDATAANFLALADEYEVDSLTPEAEEVLWEIAEERGHLDAHAYRQERREAEAWASDLLTGVRDRFEQANGVSVDNQRAIDRTAELLAQHEDPDREAVHLSYQQALAEQGTRPPVGEEKLTPELRIARIYGNAGEEARRQRLDESSPFAKPNYPTDPRDRPNEAMYAMAWVARLNEQEGR